MVLMTHVLLAIILVLLVVLTYLVYLVLKGRVVEAGDIEAAVSGTWVKLGLGDKITALEGYAKEIRDSYRSFEQMLRVPKERAALGEIALEVILEDQLPGDMYGIRSEVFDGKRPDAWVRSTVGIICIDAKFPLDNFAKMAAAEDLREREAYKKQFLKDVQGHLEKIANDYVRPGEGSADFAFAYLPSESVYHFLVSEAFDLLRSYAKRGVQVVSPLTFSQRIELIKAGVHAKKLSEEARKVQQDLQKLSRAFDRVDRAWQTFYSTHLRNAHNKAAEVEDAYRKLREEFERIAKMPVE